MKGRARAFRLVFGVAAFAASTAFALSACSPSTGFPAVHDMPAPRPDTPLTPAEVKQATDDLISQRNHLSAAAAPAPSSGAAENPGGTGSAPGQPASASGKAQSPNAYAKP